MCLYVYTYICYMHVSSEFLKYLSTILRHRENLPTDIQLEVLILSSDFLILPLKESAGGENQLGALNVDANIQ